MRDMDAILKRLRENEDIAKKFHEIEIKILSILDFKDLFESLLSEFEEKFSVPYVWISLIEASEVSTLIQSLETSDILRERMNVTERTVFRELVGRGTRPVLVNQDLVAYRQLLPKDKTYRIGSMAIAPISLDGEIIGSLNQADSSPHHFSPTIDTSLLEWLAVKVSLCLSNVTAHEKLKFLAYHDPLTGLLNRRVLEGILKREFARSSRYNSPLSLVFLDLDDFKKVNDRYGHDSGDRLLEYVAEQLIEASRESDVVARFAGDEFVVILPETSRDNAEKLISRLESYLLDHPLMVGESPITASITFGVASTEDRTIDTPNMLLKKADERQYQVKHRKKVKE